MKICFDMDGTIANLYGVENWLDFLLEENPYPYMVAKPLVNMSVLARKLNQLRARGYEICVISWLSKNSTPYYDELVTDAKMNWLHNHLKSVEFDEINIVPYGTPKSIFGDASAILFDDEERNRNEWIGMAFDVENIIEVLKTL